ncbi:putative autophagy-related protein 11 [Macrobrachium nipponense]|uniref:putative autophagy-related protein 11 n=1 Tax=Macrobrachium nipponense TaxID=159736 RepID=UPI0030C8165E
MNERHRNSTDEMEQSNRLMKAELERAKEENRAQMERQSQLLKEKEKLEKDIKKQAHIIKEKSEENVRLQKELMEANMNDFVQGEKQKALLTELDGLKEKISFLENNCPSLWKRKRTKPQRKIYLRRASLFHSKSVISVMMRKRWKTKDDVRQEK